LAGVPTQGTTSQACCLHAELHGILRMALAGGGVGGSLRCPHADLDSYGAGLPGLRFASLYSFCSCW